MDTGRKMKKLIYLLVLANIASFWTGRLTEKPVIKTITQKEEVKVYDFSQEPKVIEQYANFIGKTLSDKKEIEEQKHSRWQVGFEEGYKVGVAKR